MSMLLFHSIVLWVIALEMIELHEGFGEDGYFWILSAGGISVIGLWSSDGCAAKAEPDGSVGRQQAPLTD